MSDIINEPIKFLGATVLSFNSSLGLGSASESTLNVDLIEDCDQDDSFFPADGSIQVGDAVYFNAGAFKFGGVLSTWTISQGSGGKVYNVKVVDPRQLLENTAVIVDSYLGPPSQTVNYFNVYNINEGSVLGGDCSAYGSSQSNERGMPYTNIINSLSNMNPTICSPTGQNYIIDFSSFPQNVPEYYRVAGPSITILQLLQDVCDVLGFEFHVKLNAGAVISVGLIDLKVPPSSFRNIIDSFDGIATDLSYGEELRNEKTRALLLGEQQHYLSYIDKFDYYFGEDIVGQELVPVVPFQRNDSGFWISKRIEALNASLLKPLPSNGPYEISELDIRCAMSGIDNFLQRALDNKSAGSFNKAIRDNWSVAEKQLTDALKRLVDGPNLHPQQRYKILCDLFQRPDKGGAEAGKPQAIIDLEKIHNFLVDLGNTYYGKQFISPLNQTICYYQGENFQEKIYTDVPTTNGGWVDAGTPVLGLSDPELGAFRTDDNRIGCFAIFTVDGISNIPAAGEDGKQSPPDNVSGGGSSPGETPIE